MADTTRTTWLSFMYEMQAEVAEQFSTENVFLAELNGVGSHPRVGRFTRDMDANREVFFGEQVRGPIVPYGLQGGGVVGETSTWNEPIPLEVSAYTLTLTRTMVPFAISVDVERDSASPSYSKAKAVAENVKQARRSLARLENLQALGDGTGLISNVTAATGSPGLTVPVGVGANFDVLVPGTVWDVLTRSNGANPGNGLRRKITSVSESAGTVTFDTNETTPEGDAGNITFSANEGLYIPGSYGKGVAQGLDQAAAVTGTFEGINKATAAYWQGTDGRAGDATEKALSDELLDAAVRRARRWGVGSWNFGIGDPAAIDLYKQGKNAQVQYDKAVTTLKSGFQGIVYEGADKPFPLIKEPAHKKKSVRLIQRDDFQMYGDSVGPKFLDDDGSMFRRFSRSLPKEADLLDRWQLGVKSCNRIVFLDNLKQAA